MTAEDEACSRGYWGTDILVPRAEGEGGMEDTTFPR